MAEIRCPMCSKPNEETAEVCAFCGARIKPLHLQAGPEVTDSEAGKGVFPSGDEGEESTSDQDWLARIRGQTGEETTAEEEDVEPQADHEEAVEPDLRAALRLSDQTELSDRSQQQAYVEPEPDEQRSATDEEDWLERLRESEGQAAPPSEGEEVPGWLEEFTEESRTTEPEADEVPDWLSRIRERKMGEAEGRQEEEDWITRLRGEAPVEEPEGEDDVDLTTWQARFKGLAAIAETGADEEPEDRLPAERVSPTGLPVEEEPLPAEDLSADTPSLEGLGFTLDEGKPSEIPSWLEDLESEVETQAEGLEQVELPSAEESRPSWLEDVEVEGPVQAPEGEARPSWLEDVEIEGPVQAPEGEARPSWLEDVEVEGPVQAPEGEARPSWLEDVEIEDGVQAPEGEARPSWLEDLEPEAADGTEVSPGLDEAQGLEDEVGEALPRVPALILDDKDASLVGMEGRDFDLDAVEVPEWLSEVQERPPDQEPPEKGVVPDLAPATLPAWLEAMRPVDTFQSAVEIEPEEDLVVESAGPLAGLRGVLMAEPVMAMPRSSTLSATQLDLSDRHYKQAELLQQMVAEEERELPPAVGRRARGGWVRQVIALILVVAIAIPIVLGLPSFDLPSPGGVPLELAQVINLVNGLSPERPVLLVFDYEPGYAAELNAVAGAMLEQVAARGLPIVTMSTHPNGPPLAVRMVDDLASRHEAYNVGAKAIHLGYLSGGPTAVQLFAQEPRQAILRGFALPRTLGDTEASPWDAEALAGVRELSDFSMVAVITGGMDSARTWAEQASPYMGSTPLVMVLSAGAEPLVRPYFESPEPQVTGILSGLPTAAAYELFNQSPGQAQGRWNPFGAGMLIAELVLAVGALYGVGTRLVRFGLGESEG